jgi:two-component system sensor histidine kinase KdpD
MEALDHARRAAQWLGAILTAACATALLVALGANSTTAGLVYLAIVVWFAAQAGTALAALVAILCSLLFDYFFLPPFRTLRITGAQQWVAMVCFMVSCAVVGRVAEVARRQTRRAEQRREDVERLYSLSQEMMLHEDAEALLRDLPLIVDRTFSMNGVILYVCDTDRFYSSTSELPMSIQASLRAMTQGHNPTLVIPGNLTARPLMLGMTAVGAIAWRPAGLSREVSTAVCAQVATVIARSTALEASARAEAARESERLRTALTDSLTHELRTPLTSIRAAATTLLRSPQMNEVSRQDMVSIIDEESARLDLLIGEAVEMAEIEANAVEVKLAPIQPRALLEEAIEQSRKALAAHRVAIDENTSDELSNTAWLDRHLIGRVLRHLLENAAAYTPPGSHIALGSRRRNERLEFFVDDDGPGIDAHDLPLIFEKFYRGKHSSKVRKGSGMGLAIVRAILAAHGGGIEVTSSAGKGSSFQFWIPLVEKEPPRKN